VIFILRQKPQKEFKRSGPKDIVHIGPPVERGVVYYYHTVQSLMGTNIVMMGNALELSFQSGGMGGFIEETFILEGMQDPDDPWEKDPGDLIVKLYNTGVRFEERIVRTRVAPHSVYLVGSGDAAAAEAYTNTANQIAAQLRSSHIAPGGYLIEAQGRQKDGAVIVGLNFNFDDPNPMFKPNSDEVAKTVAAYNDAFCQEYPINRDAASAGLPGILYGRYPGDTYDGGNPWILTTAALAQTLYRVGFAAASGEVPAPETLQTWADSLNVPDLAKASGAAAAKIFSQAGDATLDRIAHYVRNASVNMRLDEQIEKHSGALTSAKSLTWSYAEVFNALLWRGKLQAKLR